MTFNYREFKKQFLEAAQRHGIDPESGASEFQAVLIASKLNTDLHHSRQRELVRAAAARQAEQSRRGVRWSEGSGLLLANGAIDETLVAKAEDKNWWTVMHPDDWKPGANSSYVERQAMTPIRRNNTVIQRQKVTREEMGEAVREVLKENPSQQAMRAKRSLKERV